MAVSEMVSANPRLWNTRKSRERMDHIGEGMPRAVQIAGADPGLMAAAARFNVDNGAQIIDINMGCPAKKVCNAQAGSALLGDESLVARILEAVVAAVTVPVTLKIRTGLDPAQRNGVRVARIAERAGIAAVAVHGRTRACAFRGDAEYATVRAIKQAVRIPVLANGDIDSPERARAVLSYTGADALMIGRGAQGNPWIFREIRHYLETGEKMAAPTRREVRDTLVAHLENLYGFYGEHRGVRIARKHLAWYSKGRPGGAQFWQRINRVESSAQQLRITKTFFDGVSGTVELAA